MSILWLCIACHSSILKNGYPGVLRRWSSPDEWPLYQARRENLKRLMQPRHIAFVGGKAVEDCINATRKSGFAGEIWVVHPKYEKLAGITCVPSLADLPESPDAALIAVSRALTIDIVAEFSSMGAGGAPFSAASELSRQDRPRPLSRR